MSGQEDGRTAKLLISEPPLLVLPSLAVLVGLNEAIFLQQLHYWLQGKAAKERDGRLWIYNTYEEWHQQLPFWSIATLRRIVNGLEQRGLVLSTNTYNAHKVDRTKWYSLDYSALAHLSERADHVLNLSSPSAQDDQMQSANLSSSGPETTPETTNRERRFEDSNDRSIKIARYDNDRQLILRYLEDYARELNDQAPLGTTTSRAQRLYQESGLSLDAFIQSMSAARAITQERTASIKATPVGAGPWSKKPKMAYFFAVLEDLVGEGGERRQESGD